MKEANRPIAHQLLNQDFELAKSYGVHGFPTIIMVNKTKKGVKIVGVRSLEDYENGLRQVLPPDITMEATDPQPLTELLKKEKRLFRLSKKN
ncbi:hypothetical protein [Shimazuella alba]|uniref:hypothetical protein n=1 Tax=Shimazuella alba TaxID=2690964 RepID=UPI0030843CE3